MKFGIVVFPSMSINEIVEWGKIAEENGFQYIWMPDESPSPGYKDIFVLLTALGLNTKKAILGTSIFNPYTRHPAIVANALLSIAELTNDRIIYGIGPGGILTLGPLGIKMWEKPVKAVRDAVKVVRSLFKGEKVTFENEFFKVVDLKLEPTPKNIPIYIAARGNQMLTLAGKYGDGVLLTTPINYLEPSVNVVKKAAEKVGRKLEDIDIANWMPFGVDTNADAARESVKGEVALLVSFLPEYMIESAKVDQEKANKIKELMRSGKRDDAIKLVDDAMIDQFAVAGTPNDVIEKIKYMEKHGLTHIMVGDPFGPDPKKALAMIGNEVMPTFEK
ncbi:MAG: 5,10-methylenetetrahydromethanopterin reductase [Candidatus Asgardarchaeia archaeon]